MGVTTSFELRLCSRISEVVLFVVAEAGVGDGSEDDDGMFFLGGGGSVVPFSTMLFVTGVGGVGTAVGAAVEEDGGGWSLISCGWTVSDDDDDDVATVVSVDVGDEDDDEGEALVAW